MERKKNKSFIIVFLLRKIKIKIDKIICTEQMPQIIEDKIK
jgi:hypothetical protein